MKIKISKKEANVIQVALDHLFDMHFEILYDVATLPNDPQRRESAHIVKMIEDIQDEIKFNLNKK